MPPQSHNPKSPAQLIWLLVRHGVLRSVLAAEVEWIEAASNYVAIRLRGGELLITRATIESVEKRLGHAFVRIHRKFVVNRELLKEIRNVNGQLTAVLSTGSQLPVSRHYKPQLVASLGGSKELFPRRQSTSNKGK